MTLQSWVPCPLLGPCNCTSKFWTKYGGRPVLFDGSYSLINCYINVLWLYQNMHLKIGVVFLNILPLKKWLFKITQYIFLTFCFVLVGFIIFTASVFREFQGTQASGGGTGGLKIWL